MAEAIILPLTTFVLKKIASFTSDLVLKNVTEEFIGFKSVKKDLKVIAENLERITAVLQDAEAKQYSNAGMNIWLRDLKSVVYDIDDLLDEVVTDALQRSVNKGHLLPQLRYYLSLKPLILHCDLSHKIKHLRLELASIVSMKKDLGLTERPVEAPSVKRDALDNASGNASSIVGRDVEKTSIINTVTSLCDESSVAVLPIYGMAGIGKTALAKLVYNDINRFDIKLWVCVSDKFDLQKILEDILKDATGENTSNYTLRHVIGRLEEVLKGKKYLLVLDDLWEDNNTLWMRLKSILVGGGRGSVILITTRSEKVASITQTFEAFNLDKLSNSVCWSIFEKFAFADSEEGKHPKLRGIGMSIVEKCCGNPLVVQCLGSLLRCERDEREWLRIKNMDNLNQLDGQYDTVKQLLKLSYNKLPSHLKPLFAHLSLNAKDFVYLPIVYIYYYSALGLLQLPDGSYFNLINSFKELLSRSMLQEVDYRFCKTFRTFKIHDLLHDLAGDILGEELAVVTRNNLSVPNSSRYIAWDLNDLSNEGFPIKAKKARAFIFRYRMTGEISKQFLEGIISNLPSLRILVLQSSQFYKLPSSIGNLKHLRFLDLAHNFFIKSLPDTICQLLNLEYLRLFGCERLEELPSEIYKLINLRLFSLTTRQRSLVGTKFNRLPSLQDMWFNNCVELVSLWDSDDVGRLTSIRNLVIMDCPKLTSLPNSMKQLVQLEEFGILNCKELDLEKGDALTGLQGLRTLAIKGIPLLTCLPRGMFSAASSLKYLTIKNCRRLGELPKWLQSFVCLEKLSIESCQSLLCLPQGIRHLNSLQHLEIENCPHLSRRCAVPDGEDLPLIRHVPEIWLDGRFLAPNQQRISSYLL